MRPGRLLLVPLLVALAYGAALAFVPAATRPPVYFAFVEGLRVLAAVACVAAALRYSAGDRLFVAWLLFALNLVLLLLKDLLFGAQLHVWSGASDAAALRSGLVIAGNLATVVAMAMLAGAWRSAGLASLESRGRQIAVALAAIALAAVTVGFAMIVNLRGVEHGHGGALEHLASDSGDFVTFCLIAPLALVTFALRGGTLFWAWLFVVLSKLGWMLFDVLIGVGEVGHTSARLKPWTELARCLALALMLVAGLAARAGAARRRG
jgi:hypothetical protein